MQSNNQIDFIAKYFSSLNLSLSVKVFEQKIKNLNFKLDFFRISLMEILTNPEF